MREPTVDWMIATAVAGTLLIGAEVVKLVLRMGSVGLHLLGAGRKEPCWSIAFARVSRPAALTQAR